MKQYGEIAKKILIVIGIAGVVSVAVIAPGALLAAKPFVRDPYRFDKKQTKQKAARAVRRLQENNLITVKEKNGKFIWELTKAGKKKFKDIQVENLKIPKPARWDGKWRIVIFDIPEEPFRYERDILREKLREWEFYPLQKSVWVSAWPCEKEIRVIGDLYGVSRYVSIIIAEKIFEDVSLREHFGLK